MRWTSTALPATDLLDHLGGARSAHEPLGITLDTAYRWIYQHRTLSLWMADRYATRAGVHPAEVWPEWYLLTDKVLDEVEQ